MSLSMRSVLFLSAETPPEELAELAGEADAVILDLEDLVAPAARLGARDGLAARIAALPDRFRRYVRVNGLSTPLCFDDLAAAVTPRTRGLVFPKIESLSDLTTADWIVAQFERGNGSAVGSTEIVAIIETAKGVSSLRDLVDQGFDRPLRLSLGIGDLGAELNLTVGHDEAELAALRSEMVVVSKAAGFEAPIDAVFLDTSDTEGFAASVERTLRYGFAGKFCLNAAQAAQVNRLFRPSAETLAVTRQQLAAYEAAVAEGRGAVSVEGVFVDAPVAERLRRILARG